MDHTEVAEYLVEMEETLSEWDSPVSLQFELEKVHNIIKQLTDNTFSGPNLTNRMLVACLKEKARKISNYIIMRNRMQN